MRKPAETASTYPAKRIVKCPSCSGESLFEIQNVYRPFCCERCKKTDLGAWASESFRVPAEAPADDLEFGDPKLQ